MVAAVASVLPVPSLMVPPLIVTPDSVSVSVGSIEMIAPARRVGERRARHRVVVERQRLVSLNRHLAAIERRITVDRARAAHVDEVVVRDRSAVIVPPLSLSVLDPSIVSWAPVLVRTAPLAIEPIPVTSTVPRSVIVPL